MGRPWTFPPASSTSTNRVRPTRELGERFAAAGHRAYLVGGTVRDAFLDRDLSGPDVDVDLTTDARPDAIERIVRPAGPTTCGSRASASGPSAARRRGVAIEMTTFRAEVYRPESRKPEVAYSDDLETDLSRARLHGQRDGARGCPSPSSSIRSGAPPTSRRRCCARRWRRRCRSSTTRCGCSAPRASSRASGSSRCPSSCGTVGDAARPPRDRRARSGSATSCRGLLLVDDPTAGLWFLCTTRLSDEFLPELNAMRLEQDPIHTHKDVLAHTIAVVRKTRASSCGCASPRCCTTSASRRPAPSRPGGVSFHHHEVVGARMAEERLRALAFPERRRRRRHAARVPAPAHPHVRDGVDRPGGAALRA